MRLLAAFACFVGLSWAVAGLSQGRMQEALAGLALGAVAGALLWRSLRDAKATRRGGLFAQVTFSLRPGSGLDNRGTAARIETHNRRWEATLDRPPERADLDSHGIAHGGWVWLDPAGLPEKVRIDYANTWQTWPVIEAVSVPQPEGPLT